jgi:hypothetical protein
VHVFIAVDPFSRFENIYEYDRYSRCNMFCIFYKRVKHAIPDIIRLPISGFLNIITAKLSPWNQMRERERERERERVTNLISREIK